MSQTHTLRLPKRFVIDRLERDLPCGETRNIGHQVVVMADAATLKDMAEDADYQARWTDIDDIGLKRSAARACELLVELLKREGLPEPRLGI